MTWNNGMLIYNGKAGQQDTRKALGACVPILSPNVKQLRLLPTQEKGDAERFCKQLGEKMDVLFILGGDGTVHECINGIAALKKRPTIGILPGGTCNDFSRELNMPQNIEKAALAIVEGKSKMIDVGMINERYFLNFSGIGLIADTSSNIDDSQKNLLGKVSYFLSALRTVKDATPFSFRLDYGEGIIEDDAILILVGNGSYIGTNKLPLKPINASDGLFDIIIVKNSNIDLLKEILFTSKLEQPENRTNGELIYIQSDQVQLTTTNPMKMDTDGELYLHSPAKIEMLPQHINFIYQID